jgi:hypothetical protein
LLEGLFDSLEVKTYTAAEPFEGNGSLPVGSTNGLLTDIEEQGKLPHVE